MRLNLYVPAVLLALTPSAIADTDAAERQPARASYQVPTLLQIRDILSNLEAPIINAIVERFSLPANPSLYQGGKDSELHKFLATQEQAAAKLGRYDYGTMEYAYTLPPLAADVATSKDKFPPGTFHLDKFYGNTNLTTLYTESFIPLLNKTSMSFYFHLSTNASTPGAGDKDAALALDAALLSLLSHRSHIGKVVAESKYAGNATQYAALIKAKDATAIRALLTNTTQETVVMQQADAVASTLTTAWANSGQIVLDDFSTNVRNATQKIFRGLIDITTDIEIEYLLQRL